MNKSKRSHGRLQLESEVTIELESPEGEPARQLSCKVLDVSYGGFSVMLKEELAVGAVLPVEAKLVAVEKPFRLRAEVVWCRSASESEGMWAAGFSLYFSHDSDIGAWRELLEHV